MLDLKGFCDSANYKYVVELEVVGNKADCGEYSGSCKRAPLDSRVLKDRKNAHGRPLRVQWGAFAFPLEYDKKIKR